MLICRLIVPMEDKEREYGPYICPVSKLNIKQTERANTKKWPETKRNN